MLSFRAQIKFLPEILELGGRYYKLTVLAFTKPTSFGETEGNFGMHLRK